MELTLELIRNLFIRFSVFYGEKFTKNYPNEDYIKMWVQDWFEGLAGIPVEQIKEAINHCRLNLAWPPSLAEFREVCEGTGGMPSCNDAFLMGCKGDFSHDIIKRIFKKIDHYNFKLMAEDSARDLFTKVYKSELVQYRIEKQKETLNQIAMEGDNVKKLERIEVRRDNTRGSGVRSTKNVLLSSKPLG